MANSRGASGYPANAQGSKTSWAQSGGNLAKSNQFQGGTGGGAWQSAGGGNRGTGKKGAGQFGNGTNYNIRDSGGDGTLVKGAHGGAGKLGMPQGPNPKTSGSVNNTTPHELAPPGFGGGY